jgi:site-specific recombinase XerD
MLLDQVREQARLQRLSLATERCYCHWVERYVRFHRTPEGWRHPKDLTAADLERFLTHLAVHDNVSASTQNQALSAILFLYRSVLRLDLGPLDAVRAHRSRRVPVVLSRAEVARPQRRQHDDDLHPRPQPRAGRDGQPA